MDMATYFLGQLPDHALLRGLRVLLATDRVTTAALLAHLAEVDARRLYLPAGYPSMYAYCVGELRLSEDTAFKRLRAARAAREHPAILAAIEDGRLTVSTVLLLAPHLTHENARELLAGAGHQTNAAVELLLAHRFPKPDLATSLRTIPPACLPAGPDGPVPSKSQADVCEAQTQLAARPVHPVAPQPVAPPAPPARIAPLAPERYALQVTLSQEAHDLPRQAQDLLGHAIPSGDVAQVLTRAFRELVTQLEQRRFAETDQPRPRRSHASGRYVPAEVRREVWKRDEGRCSFLGANGHRCGSRRRLGFDHATPVARGGETTAANLRLRCRAHNQYEAERVFGEAFMRVRRERSGPSGSNANASTKARADAGSAAGGPPARDTARRDAAPGVHIRDIA